MAIENKMLEIFGVRKVEMYRTGIVLELENGQRLNRKEIRDYKQNGLFKKNNNSAIFYDALLGTIKVYYSK